MTGPRSRPALPNVGCSIPGARAHFVGAFFLASGRSSGPGIPPPTLANPLLAASDVGGPAVDEAGVHKKSDSGDFSTAVPPHIDDTENAYHLILDSLALSRISLALVNLSFVLPLILHHLPAVSPPFLDIIPPSWTRDEYHRCIWMHFAAGTRRLTIFSHNSKKAKFLVFHSTHPYANEGWGSCYAVACVDDADIVLYRAGTITAADLKARIKWKVGHTNDPERRQREYEKCNVGQTHIWICRWEASRRYYCERFVHLQQLCDGGERIFRGCVCGVRHREYVTFSSVGGFAQFRALVVGILFLMNEPITPVFYQPSPSTADIYNLITQS
ncbi:hypothetical protein B0H13DRAFT_2340557 [Mycena leptocephala]|nr:hypothetical protein B0H13DRAFT_2350662 [Mycena leptocephala]KAJ7891466.1 hypothetical protein B0H13DRAFT_2340557 [Mycena leptocephala]